LFPLPLAGWLSVVLGAASDLGFSALAFADLPVGTVKGGGAWTWVGVTVDSEPEPQPSSASPASPRANNRPWERGGRQFGAPPTFSSLADGEGPRLAS
jgi:hypothetical protein